MRKIAEALGLSVATVSRALRQDPVVRPETLEAVQRMAQQIGYTRNAYVGEFMSSIRRSQTKTFKGNIGLLWGEQVPQKRTDRRLLQIQLGAQTRAEELGYGLSEFGLSGLRPEALARILVHRGIRGILIAIPSFSPRKAYLRFDFSKFVGVSVGWGLLKPVLHTVRFDYFQAMRLALHHAHHAFGGDIAAVWDVKTDRRAHRVAQASFLVHHPKGSEKALPLFLDSRQLQPKLTLALLKKHQIRCLLVEPSVEVPRWLLEAIPRNHHVLFRDPGSEPCFGWVDTQNALLGRWGVDLLATKLSLHESGLPSASQVVLIPPLWAPSHSPSIGA